MSSEQIVFFDLASRQDNQCWSLNPWKTRLLLNYKDLDYKTEFLNYPEVKPTLEKHVGFNPSTQTWTIPTVKFPDGTYVMDSKAIAVELEKRYPAKSSKLDSVYLPKVEALIPEIMKAMAPVIVVQVPLKLLNDASLEYWHKTRLPRFPGKTSLAEVERDLGGAQAYVNAQPYVREITKLLRENSEGPFFEGKDVTYADFVWVGLLRFGERLGGDVSSALLGDDKPVHDALLAACRPWLERDNY